MNSSAKGADLSIGAKVILRPIVIPEKHIREQINIHEMCQNSVSHEARAKEVLFCYVVDRKFHSNNNGCSLCCRNDTLGTRQ